MTGATWRPLVAFPNESPSFVHGFESGIIWQLLEQGQAIERTVHAENAEVLQRMCRYQGYSFALEPCDVEGWAVLRAEKQCPAGALRVV